MFNYIPPELTLQMVKFLNRGEIISLALSNNELYWLLWDWVGSFTRKIEHSYSYQSLVDLEDYLIPTKYRKKEIIIQLPHSHTCKNCKNCKLKDKYMDYIECFHKK